MVSKLGLLVYYCHTHTMEIYDIKDRVKSGPWQSELLELQQDHDHPSAVAFLRLTPRAQKYVLASCSRGHTSSSYEPSHTCMDELSNVQIHGQLVAFQRFRAVQI